MEPGTVITVADSLAVVITDCENGLVVIPLSDQVSKATNYDLLFRWRQQPIMAEIWNYVIIDPTAVVRILPAVNSAVLEQLLEMYRCVYTDNSPLNCRTGPVVLSEDDPRCAFQQLEAQRIQTWWAHVDEPM